MIQNRLKHLLLLIFLATGLCAQAQTDSTRTSYPMMDYSTPKQYVIEKINVIGATSVDTEVLLASVGLRVGDSIMIPGEYLSDAIRKMWSQRYFSYVDIVTEINGNNVVLDVILQERPRVYNWKVDGVSKGNITEITEKLKLRRGAELSDYTIKNSIDVIKKYYDEKGFLRTTVDVVQVNDTMMDNGVNVTFQITKGPKVRIGAIDFDGNSVFEDKRLRRALKKTHQKSINIFASSKFKEADYEADKESLVDFYNSRGYRNAIVIKDSIYDISPERIGIKLSVEEGNQFYFRSIKWLGNTVYATDALNGMLGVVPGDMYDRKTLHKQLGIGKEGNPDDNSISSLYQNNGYLFLAIEPVETVVDTDSLDLEIKIVEGVPATINAINITGNTRVNDHVIRRELYLRPGELYNRSFVMSSIRQLAQMNHFNAETLQPGLDVVGNDLVNISLPLEEQASDKFEISGGWGAGMFVGSVGIELNNLSARNFFKKNAWRPYPSGDNQQLRLRAQTNGQYYSALSASFTEPWLGGKKPNSLSLGLFYTDETDAYFVFQKSNSHFRTIGASLGLGRRLTWPDMYFQVYNEVAYQAYNLENWKQRFLMENGTANIVSLKTVLSRNSIDQPIFPRSGSEFSLSLTLTPPYSLFDGKNYADPNLSEQQRYGWVEYHKWHFKADWYYPVVGNKLILRMAAEMGFLGSYNKNKISPFEGYDVGGDGMSGYNIYGVEVIGLRGYENGALGSQARAYNKYTMELRYPFILQPSSQIYGLVFAEGGNAFTSLKTFNPFTIKRSLGVGLRMYLPIVGMLGIDWGYGFDRAPRANKVSGSNFHFMIGMPF